jgi:hypothetical protein
LNDELERMWKEKLVALFKAPFWNLPGGIEENHERSQSE